jgi:hypothetical protein
MRHSSQLHILSYWKGQSDIPDELQPFVKTLNGLEQATARSSSFENDFLYEF